MLTIGIPAFNEEATIESVVAELLQVLPSVATSFEILAVNDGSTDRTGELLDRLAATYPSVRVVHHEQNRGFVGFQDTLLAGARGDWFAAISADGEIPPSCLDAMITRAMSGADIVVGVRQNRPRQSGYRRVITAAYNLGVRFAFGRDFRDIGGFKLYRTDVLRQIEAKSTSAFLNAERLVKADRSGYRIEFEVIQDRRREGGRAKGASLRWVWRSTTDLVAVWLELVTRRWTPPPRLARADEQVG